MNWSHFKSKLLMKYALSYILVLLIPLSIATLFIYVSAVNSLRSEIEQANINQLTQVKMTMDSRMTELREIAARMTYDEQLTPYMVRHPYFSREAVNTLNKYKANSSIIEDVFLYFRGDQVIYSSKGLTDLDVVFGQNYRFADWSTDELVSSLNEIGHLLMRPAEQVNVKSHRQQSMLALLIPIKQNNPFPYATVLYLLEESKLTGVMDSILNDFSGNSYIFDLDGQVLTANNRDEPLSAEELKLVSQLNPGIHSMVLNHEQQSVVAVQSDENGWMYVTTMPSHQFFNRVVHIQTLILVIFSVVVIVGIPITILLAKRQYHPIQDLMKFAKLNREERLAAHSQPGNEWDWIRQTIHDYSARIDIQKPYARNQCLLMLLKYGKPNDPETGRLIQMLGLELPGGQYFVMMLAWDEHPGAASATMDRQSVAEMLSELEISDPVAYAYGIELSPSDHTALMVCLPSESEVPLPYRMEQVVEAVRVIVMENSHFIPSIGVGTGYSTLEELNQSFIEAATALETRMVNGKGSITYFKKLSDKPDETFWIPKDALLKLIQSLKQGNSAVAVRMIGMIADQLKARPLSVSLMRCICFDLLNTLLKTASELGMDDIIQDIPSAASFKSLEELERKLQVMAAQICEQVERKTETERHSLLDDILLYVDQQFADYTLSLEHVALKYSISTSYLSRSFKEKTGHNFSQYIWQRRMDEVIRQLLSTNDPLKDIILRVGYLDPPNFIRKFKKETGYTPGQYRKKHTLVHPAAAKLANADKD